MKYGLAITAVIITAFLAIFLIVQHQPAQPKNAPKPVTLSDYDNQNATVTVTMQGKLVGEDQRRAIRISVSPSERRIEILDGYEEIPERSQTFPNSQEAYTAFLRGLDGAGFVKSRKSTITDFRGVCPLGNRFEYDLTDGSGSGVSKLWGASCSAGIGTMAGDGPLIRQLFQLQIPNYDQQVLGVQL